MRIVGTHYTKNVGASDSTALVANVSRSFLMIQNKHASQTVRAKFGTAVVGTDVTEVQTVSFSGTPNAGSFKLRWNGNNTAAIASSDDAAAVQAALRGVTGLTAVTVSGSFAAGFVVTMTTATPNTDADLPLLTVIDNTLNIAAVQEVQTLEFSAVPDAGNFTLGYGGAETAVIAFDAINSDVEDALQALTGLSAVAVTGDFTAGFEVTFPSSLGNVALITEASNSLENTATPVTTTIGQDTAGVIGSNITPSVAETTKGKFADGFVIAAGEKLIFGDEAYGCPTDALHLYASGSDTRIEILEG